MSDGPHRSLNMRRGWKRFAERADKQAYAPEQVCEALPQALEQEWRAEISATLPRQIREIFLDNQRPLFGDERSQRIEKLETLRSGTVGYPLAGAFLDCAVQAAANGKTGDEAVIDAVSATLKGCATRGMRQVEEHFYRKSSHTRALNVRERMKDGIAQTNFGVISMRFIGTEKSERPQKVSKRTGVDEGVPLP